MSESIAGLTATTCALFDVAAPKLCTASPHPAVLHASRAELAGAPVDRMLVYAPDAMGCHLRGRHPGHFDEVRVAAPVAVQLTSVMPTVTPVCFASMFTGAAPEAHGIRRYEKPRLTCDTLFDALGRAGKRVAIVAVKDCSIDIVFRGRDLDYFTEPYDPEVTTRALELIAAGRHEFILAYHQEYDDLLHRTEPFSAECLSASQRHVRSFRALSAAVEEHWKDRRRAIVFAPDHGAHADPETGKGTHGSNLPEDLEVTHYWGLHAPTAPALHHLRPPRDGAEWAAYHAIRRDALFAVYHPELTYDPDHPDERSAGNHPHVLVLGGEVIGTVRIDLLDADRAGLRLIAIRPDLQRRGHGAALLRLAEQAVRAGGRREVVLNANPEVVGFYLAAGYAPGAWPDPVAPLPGAVKMGKRL